MEFYSETVQNLITEFELLPGIGRKSAERLAYHILRASEKDALGLARAIQSVKENVRHCRICYHLTEKEICSICDDPQREPELICVVEQPKDLYAIEAAGTYRGHYHVLLGAFAPLDGVRPEDLTTESLIAKIRERAGSDRSVREVIIATNPNFEGDGTALLISQRLKEFPDLRVSRIARGMPAGSNLEHVSKSIVADALEGRRSVED